MLLQRRCPANLQTLQVSVAATVGAGHFGSTSIATDTLSDSLGSMAVSPGTSCAQLLADSTDTFMTEYEALDPALLGTNAPERLVRQHTNPTTLRVRCNALQLLTGFMLAYIAIGRTDLARARVCRRRGRGGWLAVAGHDTNWWRATGACALCERPGRGVSALGSDAGQQSGPGGVACDGGRER